MSRVFFGVEKGVDIYAENGNALARILSGTAIPDGLGDQASAPIGSLYLRSGTGQMYQKIANAGNSSDWELNGVGDATVGTWRPESVVLVTNETQAPGVRDVVASPFSDDEGTAVPLGDYIVGKYIIADADGTPSLLEITNVSGNDVTFAAAASPLVADDAFVVKHYLPDSPDAQEKEAIVVYNGSIIIKIADINWNFADGINMAAGYAAANGSISSADTVNSAIQKLDGNQQDLISLSGVAQGSVDLGTFTGDIIPDASTIKAALQALETELVDTRDNVDDLISLSGVAENAVDLGTFTGSLIPDASTIKGALQSIETFVEAEALVVDEIDQNVDDLIALSGMAENSVDFGTFTGTLFADNQTAKQLFQRTEDLLEEIKVIETAAITTATAVDSVPVATYKAVEWLVHVTEDAAPANVQSFIIYAANNGTLVDDTKFANLKIGSNFNLTTSVDINAGNMRLLVASTSAGVTARVRRLSVLDI